MNQRARLRSTFKMVTAFALAAIPKAPMSQTQERQLKPPAAALSEEFSQIVSIRELADGRVLVADRREGRIVVADFASGRVTQVGRIGEGPEEYRTVTPFIRLGSDSSLMVDRLARRWLLLDGTRILGLVSRTDRVFEVTHGLIDGADSSGRFLQEAVLFRASQGDITPDSVAIVLVNRVSAAADTIARMRAPPSRTVTEARGGSITSFTRTAPILGVGESALLHGDGWLSVARLDPYRVDWRSPSGAWVLGSPLPFQIIPMNAREQEAYVRRQERPLISRATVPPPTWMPTVPPFERAPLTATPDGYLVIARTPTADKPESRYDIVDRQARLVAKLVLPVSSRVIGFGQRSVYSVLVRDDGIELLRRHPWP
jgi:hypothetical protein